MRTKRLAVLPLVAPAVSVAQELPRWYGGGVIGVSTLSADAEHRLSAESLVVSLYKPENGPAANRLVGVHVTTT